MNLETLVEQQRELNYKLADLLLGFQLVISKVAGKENEEKTIQPEEPKYLPNGIVDELQHLQSENNQTLIKLHKQLGILYNSTYIESTPQIDTDPLH